MEVEEFPEVATLQMEPICFHCSFVDNAVTRGANELCQHTSTMGVWGWSTAQHQTHTPVFIDQKVIHNPDSARWEYTPLQYWREGSTYSFAAYAPHQDNTGCKVSVDPNSHMISIGQVSLHGHNLQSTPSSSLHELFRHAPDIDWMVARAGQTAVSDANMDIEFMMQHILGKLNICVRACKTMLERPHIASVTVDSLVVSNLPAEGDFTQQLAHTPVLDNPQEVATEEWTVRKPDLEITCKQPCQLATTPTYVVEALVLPHRISEASTVEMHYTFRYTDGLVEQCSYHIPLNEAFSRFVSGYNHTLTFVVCSNRIVFKAGTIGWKEGNDVEQ